MKQIMIFCAALVLLAGCHREKVNYLGPAYISAPEDFTVSNFTANTASISFGTTGKVLFNANFSHNVSWILTITGARSKAVKKLQGTSQGLVNVEWNGTHDGLSFFRKGERAVATLTFFGSTESYSTSVFITQGRNYTVYGQYPQVGDFENPLQVEPQPPAYSPYWASFNYPTPIPNVEQGVDSVMVDYNGSAVPAVEGSQYYFIRGKGDQASFVSGIQYFGALTPQLPANADNVWVNFYLYGTGDPNSGVEIEYQEADADGTQAGYQGTDDDAFVARIVLSHRGWKLFSFKYSSLTPSLNANFGGSGNKIHEPDRLKSFDLVLVKKTNPDNPIEVYWDYPIITVGGPFDPSK